jgi:hypothetical protein
MKLIKYINRTPTIKDWRDRVIGPGATVCWPHGKSYMRAGEVLEIVWLEHPWRERKISPKVKVRVTESSGWSTPGGIVHLANIATITVLEDS